MGSSRYTFMDTLIIDAIWKKAMGMSRDEGWALFKRRVFTFKEHRGYCQTNCNKATVAFSFDDDNFGKSSIFCNRENSSAKQRLPFVCGRQTHMLFERV
jgi:hypothetical protein